MGKVIHKATIDIGSSQIISLPLGIQVLPTILMQRNKPRFWYITDEEEQKTCDYEIMVLGTGHPFPEEGQLFHYLGTVADDIFIWHIFMREAK